MEYTIIGLLSFAILLLLLSFSKKDKLKVLENQVEQLSINVLQDSYQLKKRMKILEEELLIHDEVLNKPSPTKQTEFIQPKDSNYKNERERIFSLYKRGLSYDEIAKKSTLTTEEVRIILEHVGMRGILN
jgi:hypothetical protein